MIQVRNFGSPLVFFLALDMDGIVKEGSIATCHMINKLCTSHSTEESSKHDPCECMLEVERKIDAKNISCFWREQPKFA